MNLEQKLMVCGNTFFVALEDFRRETQSGELWVRKYEPFLLAQILFLAGQLKAATNQIGIIEEFPEWFFRFCRSAHWRKRLSEKGWDVRREYLQNDLAARQTCAAIKIQRTWRKWRWWHRELISPTGQSHQLFMKVLGADDFPMRISRLVRFSRRSEPARFDAPRIVACFLDWA